MNFKNKFIIFIFIVFILSVGCVSAIQMDNNDTLMQNNNSIELSQNEDGFQEDLSQDIQNQEEDALLSIDNQEDVLNDKSDEITVNNWDELQYYCSLKDKDYVLKLKENTNYYPTNPSDSNYQIKVYNNVKIIGSNGSYIGYSSASAPAINYAAMVVPDGYKSSINLVNVNFKWISVSYGSDGVFLQIGGKRTSILQNCNFNHVTTNVGHSTIVHLKKGTATLDNCSFINCTTDYGCVSVYDSSNVKTVSMLVNNCYFENNYAKVEPGCINNCGSLTVCNTTFIKNRSFWWAGAIHTHNYGNTTIYHSHFIDNVAGWNGGALYTYSYLQVYNSEFIGNNCTTNSGGGAIGACSYQSDPHILIENCLFKNNANNCWSLDDLSTTGTGAGGAIAIMDKGSITVSNTTFISNAASIGSAISAHAAGTYGSPDVVITNNSFINHTNVGDVLSIVVEGTKCIVSGNYYYHNDVEFSDLTLSLVGSNDDYATLKVDVEFSNPQDYDSDLLNRISYDVYVDGEYLKTVDSDVFDVEFDDFDNADIYVIPTISIKKSNSVNIISTREYIFVSKSLGSDDYDGLSRQTPVKSISKALEICDGSKAILILDGVFDESNLKIDYNLTIKGEEDVLFTNSTSFIVNSKSFTLKRINISDLVNDNFIKQANGKLFIDKCVLNNNDCSKFIDADSVEITRSVLTNNNIVVFNNNHALIKNSILLNNTKLIDNNLDDVNLDYNWWGNALGNLSKPSMYNINNWMVLNANVGSTSLSYMQAMPITFGMYLTDGNQISRYNDFIKFNLNVNAVNGTLNKNTVSYKDNVVFTQSTTDNSSVLLSFNDVSFNFNFTFMKSDPVISIKVSNIQYGQELIITINAPSDISGSLNIKIGDRSLTKTIKNGQTYTFKDLKADDYKIIGFYSGNTKYISKTIESKVSVNKYDSTTTITHSAVEVGEDLVFTVTTNRGTTGNITFYVNDITETLTLSNYQATYTIKNIKRGDYLIKAVYNGNDRYDVSQDSVFIEVDNIIPEMTVSIENSSYGEAAVVDVVLNDGATGSIIVYVEGISNSSQVVNGQSKVYIYGVDVGVNQQVTVFYTGDDTYFNKTVNASMNVSKSDLAFDMNISDIHIGDDAVVLITVPAKTSGNFTINGHIVSIPMSGEVSYIIPDLDVGNYTVNVKFEGKNYFDVEKSLKFRVLEYPIPQWANDGENTQNNQKSHYTNEGGLVKWQYQISEEIIGNMVIDSEGNVYLITDANVYSIDVNGDLKWIYQTDGHYGNFSGIAAGRDVLVLPKAGDTLYFVNQSNGEKYGESNIYLASSLYSPIIDSNATIYTVSEYQFESSSYNLVITPYRLWAKGGNPILVGLGNIKPIAAPTLNDDVIVVLGEKTLMIFDAHTLKSNSFLSGNFKNVRPVIGEGNIIYAIAGDVMYAFTNEGSQLWYTHIAGGSGNQLVLDSEIGVYATNNDGNLYRYDLIDGVETLISDLSITSGILIDADHNLYFGCDNMFYAIDSNGKVLWKTDLGSKVTGNPVMNKNGTIYVTTHDNKLFALGNSTNIANDTNVSGDTNHSSSGNDKPSDEGSKVNTGSKTKVTKKASKITAKKKTFKKKVKVKKYTITLKSGKSPIKKVKVTIKIGKKTYTAKTNSKGKATFKIKKLTKKGKYTAKITFKGNKYYKATTKKVKIVLK